MTMRSRIWAWPSSTTQQVSVGLKYELIGGQGDHSAGKYIPPDVFLALVFVGACSLLRLCTLISKGDSTDNALLATELNRFTASPDFDSSHLQVRNIALGLCFGLLHQRGYAWLKKLTSLPSPPSLPKYVISEALSVAISRPSCARIACDAIHLLKSSTGAAGRHAPCPEGGESLRQLELSKQWLQAWTYLKPGGRLGSAAAGGEEMDLQAWLQQAVEELVSSCSKIQGAKDSSSAVGPSSLIAWMAEMGMSLGMTAMQAGLWKECHAAMLCCFQLCSKYACPAASATEHPPILQLGLSPSACAAAHALLQLFQQHAGSKAASLPAPSNLSFLSVPQLHIVPTPAAISAREEAMSRPQELVEAAQDLLASCRKKMQEQVQQGVTETAAAVAGGPGAISAVEIESLEFRAATFLRSEVGQKRALQALLSSPGLRGADLEPLAAACLEQQPWRNVGIACAVMGFALRTESTAVDPDYVLIARVSECIDLFPSLRNAPISLGNI